MGYKVIALARLACPRANIPSTTALATLNRASGRELGLARGANVIMPNITPPQYRALYEIYPNKACVLETAESCHACLAARIRKMGRTPGTGRGDSPNYRSRQVGLAGEGDGTVSTALGEEGDSPLRKRSEMQHVAGNRPQST